MRWLRRAWGRCGATLAEMIVVLVIIAILAGFMYFAYTRLMY